MRRCQSPHGLRTLATSEVRHQTAPFLVGIDIFIRILPALDLSIEICRNENRVRRPKKLLPTRPIQPRHLHRFRRSYTGVQPAGLHGSPLLAECYSRSLDVAWLRRVTRPVPLTCSLYTRIVANRSIICSGGNLKCLINQSTSALRIRTFNLWVSSILGQPPSIAPSG